LIATFTRSLDRDKAVFAEFFDPGRQEYGDRFDWELKRFLSQSTLPEEANVVREKTARTTRKKAEAKAPAPGPARRPRPPT
jgi:hypothetical protein